MHRPLREYFESRILKTAKALPKGEPVRLAKFLGNLKIEHFRSGYYHRKFQFAPMFLLPIFMKVKRIKSELALAKYLKDHKRDAIALGFRYDKNDNFVTPSQQAINYFFRKHLCGADRVLINDMSRKIERLAEDFGIVFDIDTIKTHSRDKRPRIKKNLQKKISWKYEEYTRFFKKRIYPLFPMKMRHNTSYDKETLFDLFFQLSEERKFAHSGFRSIGRKMKIGVPASETFFRRLKLESPREMKKKFEKINQYIYNTAKESAFFGRGKYNLAIDNHDWLFWGKYQDKHGKSRAMLVGRDRKDGASKCYRFSTSDIVTAGSRFTLSVLPFSKDSSNCEMVDNILYNAKKITKLNIVMLDRGYFGHPVINKLYSHGVKFLMPAVLTKRIAKRIDRFGTTTVIPDYEISDGKAKFNLIVVVRDGKKIPFATNIDLDENDVELAENLCDQYGKRWGIETGYRVKKWGRAKTSSWTYSVRLFYMYFVTTMYNLWLLIDSIVMKKLMRKILNCHLMSFGEFATILFTMKDSNDDS